MSKNKKLAHEFLMLFLITRMLQPVEGDPGINPGIMDEVIAGPGYSTFAKQLAKPKAWYQLIGHLQFDSNI